MHAAAPLDTTITEAGLPSAVEIDAHSAPLLADAIARREQAHVVLDVVGVEFVDSTGLRVPIGEHQEARADGGAIQLSNPSNPGSRLREIDGIDNHSNVAE